MQTPTLPDIVHIGRTAGVITAVMPWHIEGVTTETLSLTSTEVQDFLHPPVPTVPSEVTRAQAKQALHAAGLLDAVETLVEAYNDRAVTIWFNDAGSWYRNNPYVLGISLELELTDEQVDDLFRSAALFG